MKDIASVRGDALAYAKGKSKRDYEELVAFYRAKGFSDGDIVRAMVQTPQLVSPGKLGGQR